MGKLIFEFLGAIFIAIYGIVEIVIPVFTNREFFWYTKSFRSKPKGTFEERIADAQKAYNDALNKWEDLKNQSTREAVDAREKLANAEKVYAEAVIKAKRETETKNQ